MKRSAFAFSILLFFLWTASAPASPHSHLLQAVKAELPAFMNTWKRMELAYQLLQLNDLGDPVKGTTVNWTVLRSGKKVNVIPEEAQATADMRFSQIGELQRVKRQADKIVQRHLIPGTSVSVEVENRRPPLPRNRASERLAETAKLIYQEIGHRIEPAAMRFGTDAGFAYNPAGNKPAVLETMGIVGRRIHTSEEFAEINSIAPRLYLTIRMIQELSGMIELAPQ